MSQACCKLYKNHLSQIRAGLQLSGNAHTWCPGNVSKCLGTILSLHQREHTFFQTPMPEFRQGACAEVQGWDLVLWHQTGHWVLGCTTFPY